MQGWTAGLKVQDLERTTVEDAGVERAFASPLALPPSSFPLLPDEWYGLTASRDAESPGS